MPEKDFGLQALVNGNKSLEAWLQEGYDLKNMTPQEFLDFQAEFLPKGSTRSEVAVVMRQQLEAATKLGLRKPAAPAPDVTQTGQSELVSTVSVNKLPADEVKDLAEPMGTPQ
ncbi:MAG TPA: hypothetical protein PKJ26_02040 [Candidatus Woesebacteria bacterium]|nr:hypothetical protein [Candidatus Woesebacteria bacterium]